MTSDKGKSKDKPAKELNSLKTQAAETARLRERLVSLEKQHQDLQERYEAQIQKFDKECYVRDQTEEALTMAQVIVDKSPAILFRRLAGEEPRLVYVSNNIDRLGYTAEDFLSEKMHFRDIVYPDDFERLRDEIQEFAEADVEEYTQIYRVLTREGEVRWVEDQTSVVRDDKGIKTHNQGIVADITERKLAEEELRKSEEKFRRIVETAGEGFILMDQNLVIVDVARLCPPRNSGQNSTGPGQRGVQAVYGYQQGENIGQGVPEIRRRSDFKGWSQDSGVHPR
jgi:sigma-B regulation protein RsbU (phosphoserine phosphatase)